MSARNQGSKWIRKDKRLAIYLRDGCRCVYCGSAGALTLDHIRPKSKKGTNKNTNLITCCRACNERKSDKSLTTWLSLMGRFGEPARVSIVKVRRSRAPLNRLFARRMIEYGKQLATGSGARA